MKLTEKTNRTTKNEAVDLEVIVRIYIRDIRPRAQSELDWFKEQPTLWDAIENAALAKNSKGKRYSHQCRLSQDALNEAHRRLRRHYKEIEGTKSFNELHSVVEELVGPIPGIGELYIYDTSLRIGSKLSLLPDKVYIHRGTRDGARNLLGIQGRNATSLEVAAWPQAFRDQLEPHEMEDVLCIFKDEFKLMQDERSKQQMLQRSWCG